MSRRRIVVFAAAFALVLALLLSVRVLYSLDRMRAADRVSELQLTLERYDLLIKHRFRDPAHGQEVLIALRSCVGKMTAGHPDAKAFVTLAELVHVCAGFDNRTARADLARASAAAKQIAAPVFPDIVNRTQAVAAWIDEEAKALAEIEEAEAAAARGDLERAGLVFERVPAASIFAPRALRVRERIAEVRQALAGGRGADLAAAADQARRDWEERLARLEDDIGQGRLAEAAEQLSAVPADAPDWVIDRLRANRERLSVEQVRAEAQKAYWAGKGAAVLAILETTTQPELIVFREQVAKVVLRWAELQKAEEDGRIGDVERLSLDITMLDLNPRSWYREQVLRLGDADPAGRAARWLLRAVQFQGLGELADARRLMEAAREVNPGSAAAESAVNGLVSSIQKEFNLLTAQVRAGKTTPEAALERLDRLRAGLLPADKFADKLEEFRLELGRQPK